MALGSFAECGMGRPAVIPRDGAGFRRQGAASVLFRAPWPSLPPTPADLPTVCGVQCVQDPPEGPAWAEDEEGGFAKMKGMQLLP